MNKTFREWGMFILGLIVSVPYWGFTCFIASLLLWFWGEWDLGGFMIWLFAILFLLADGFYLYYAQFGERFFGRITLFENRIKWSCAGFRSVEIDYNAITQCSIENASALNRGLPVIRGDEESYICLSISPLPEKYRGKITTYRNREGFIKFKYMDDVCEALIKVLPIEKTGSLRGFYAEMQLADEKMAKEAARSKRRKERQKELKVKRKTREKAKKSK